MKLYLAGPMTGYPNDNVARFNELAGYLRYRGYEVVNPADFDQTLAYDTLILLGLRALEDCAGVATHGKWRESNGAAAEVRLARTKCLPVRPWWYWELTSRVHAR